MTAKNVKEGVAARRVSNRVIAGDTRTRAQELAEALLALEAEQRNDERDDEIARRVSAAVFNEEREPLTEEAGQVAGFLGVTPSTSAPAPVDTPTPPAPTPTTTTPVAVVAPDAAPRCPSRLDPHHWGFLGWLFAIIGAIIGAVVASNTWSPLVDDISGFGRGLLTTMWWIGLIGFGFFGGGALGCLIDDRE
ncbi:MAG: hypothetical protein AAB459_01810 [Patescibacteria group bacterium]